MLENSRSGWCAGRQLIALWVGAAVLLCVTGPTPVAQADDAIFDLHFDTDLDDASGCALTTPVTSLIGIELTLRTTVDLVTEEVTAITHLDCVGGSFGAEVPVTGGPALPWSIAKGETTTGSALIETYLPLSLVGSATVGRAYATLASPVDDDALTESGGVQPSNWIVVALSPVPTLGHIGLLILISLFVVGAFVVPSRAFRSRAFLLVLAGLILAAPLAVRAAFGDGTLRSWLPSEQVASDALADALEGADIASLYTALDVAQSTLYIRLDALIVPPVCPTGWGTVDPGTGYPCQQEPPPDQGPFSNQIALTFDDGPNPLTTPGILDILRNETPPIPATFFMLGEKLETAEERDIAREIYHDPLFEVANHTYDHADLTTVSQNEVANQLDTTSDLLREAVGDCCLFMDYFRFPRGRADCDSMEVVRERGFAVAGVNIDPVDWCYADGVQGYCDPARAPWVPNEYRWDMPGYAVQRFQTKGGGIMLMHDIHQNTLNELQAVIDALQAAGATFVRLDHAIFPVLNGNVNRPAPPSCCEGMVN